MDYDEINLLPEQIKQKIITEENAVRKLMVELYFSPYRYKLSFADDDDRSDFILYMQTCLPRVFKNYNADIKPFAVYFYSYVHGTLYSWNRRKIRQKRIADAMTPDLIQMHETVQELYEKEEFPCAVEIKDNKTEKQYSLPLYSKKCTYTKCKKRIIEKTILILTLKSCYYLSDKYIPLLSELCGCSKKMLQDTVFKIRKDLESKASVRQEFQHKRDYAYYMHRKYMAELKNRLTKDDTYKDLFSRYEKHTRNWQKKNDMLKNNYHRVCPTNKAIGAILGICERQISYYISEAKRNIH